MTVTFWDNGFPSFLEGISQVTAALPEFQQGEVNFPIEQSKAPQNLCSCYVKPPGFMTS